MARPVKMPKAYTFSLLGWKCLRRIPLGLPGGLNWRQYLQFGEGGEMLLISFRLRLTLIGSRDPSLATGDHVRRGGTGFGVKQ